LKSVTDCCQTEWQIQQGAWGSAHTAHVSQQCLYENRPQMIEKEQWLPNNYPISNTMEISRLGSNSEAISKPSSEAQNSF